MKGLYENLSLELNDGSDTVTSSVSFVAGGVGVQFGGNNQA